MLLKGFKRRSYMGKRVLKWCGGWFEGDVTGDEETHLAISAAQA